MNWLQRISILLLCLGSVTPVAAGGFWHCFLAEKDGLPNCVGKFLCDDYCKKCPPPAKGPTCWECDDYCRKCAPAVAGVKLFQCDDYCRKPFQFCCPANLPFWKPIRAETDPVLPQPTHSEP